MRGPTAEEGGKALSSRNGLAAVASSRQRRARDSRHDRALTGDSRPPALPLHLFQTLALEIMALCARSLGLTQGNPALSSQPSICSLKP